MKTEQFILGDLLRRILFDDNHSFCRVDIVILYLALECWHDVKLLDPIYTKLQMKKLELLNSLNAVSIHNQINRFLLLARNKDGKFPRLVVGCDFRLIDGAHRLSYFMYHNITKVDVQVKEEIGKVSGWEHSCFKQLYNVNENLRIEQAKENLISDLKRARWN